MHFSSNEVKGWMSFSWDDKISSTSGTFLYNSPETAPKSWYQKLLDLINGKWVQKCFSMNYWSALQMLSEWIYLSASPIPSNLLLPLPYFSFQTSSSHTLCTWLDNFPPLWGSAFSGAAKSKKSAPSRCASETTFLRKNGNAVPQKFVQVHQYPPRMESLILLKQSSWNIVFVKKDSWRHFYT